MAEEPEEMQPQQRAAVAVVLQQDSVDEFLRRQKE
jgi:hypothetical protein